jgi:predicted O-methyltransferase YrrM
MREGGMTLTEPYSFDQAYARCYALPEVAMDKRHVYLLRDILDFGFKSTLELGSFNGASSTAFIEAVNAGKVERATFCECTPTHSLRSVIGNCRHPDRVRLTTKPSWDVLEGEDDFDLILVDANHDLESVAKELTHLLQSRPLCVVAHDTNATAAGLPKCEGAQLLKQVFEAMPDYYCLEDRETRAGELTHRGFFLATRDPNLFYRAKQAFGRWA